MPETPILLQEPSEQSRVPTMIVDDVHVEYRFDVSGMHRLRSIFSWERSEPNVVHAIRGVSLVARQGEVIGLIGRNGAGKSTLLTAMTGLLPIASGRLWVSGQPVRLGVGAVLMPMLPAADNIMLGCLAMGMAQDEIEARMDDIIAFSGIGTEAAQRPLAGYSSGMRSRIQFAIATAASPDILMVDEALSVGDEAFRRRSRDRLLEIAADAKTVFIVSHSSSHIRELCTRVVWLDGGVIKSDGDVAAVLQEYESFMKSQR